MKNMNEQNLEEIIQQILMDVKGQRKSPELDKSYISLPNPNLNKSGIFSSIDEAVSAAREAHEQLLRCSLQKRNQIIAAIRAQAKLHAKELANMAFTETKFGDPDCKFNKNLLVAEKTPGTEILEPIGFTGDHGLTLIERAPYGVIGSITPSTNPTATLTNNAIGMISAGNSVVFNVHPRAKEVSIKTITLLNQAVQSVNGPANLLTGINEPTIESAKYLMAHKGIDLLLVTGGPDVVKVAMSSGKRAICAGPGNPPCVVDETANIDKAAKDIVKGASFDNNLPCTCEKETIVIESVAEKLKQAMCRAGAYEVKGDLVDRLMQAIFKDQGSPWKHGLMNLSMIGQPAYQILSEIGVKAGSEIKLIVVEVSPQNPLIWTEQMMPVLPIVRVKNFDEAVDLALRAEQGFHHTAGVHSLDLRNLSKMAKLINTSLFIKNGPHYAGLGYESEGYTSFSIGTFTREGLTTARTFTWERRCVLMDHFRIV